MTDIVFTKYHLQKMGGLEKYSIKIITKYLEKDYSLTLLTTAIAPNLISFKNLNIVIFKIPKCFSFFRLKLFDIKCRRWVKKNKSKAIFSFDRSSHYTHTRLGNGIHLTYLKRKMLFENFFKLFLNFINPKNFLLLHIEKKGFRQTGIKKIIVNSNMVQKELLCGYKIDPAKIEIIHNGVEYAQMENDFNNWQIAKEQTLTNLNLKISDFHILFIGNDYKRKGLFPLLKALSEISERHFHLTVIGKEKNINKFIKLAKKLRLDKKVSFLGARDDIIKFYQLADALVIPTYYDPFSNVAIEALAMGVFVITSQFNGAKEIISEENGKIVDILNIKSFANTLKLVIETKKDPNRAKTIRETVRNLDFSIQLDKLTKAINI